MEDTANCAPTRRLNSSMTLRSHFATGSSTSGRARTTRWCKRLEAVCRTSPKAAWRSATSKKTELKLTGVARASLEELLLDYQAFLRRKGLRLWAKDSPEALAVRKKYSSDESDKQSDRAQASDTSDPYSLKTASPEVSANTLICLINQASYLLGRQLRKLEQQFVEEGGFTERLYKVRTQARKTK